MIFHIKNMVCDRCIEAVKTILNDLSVEYSAIELGLIKTKNDLQPEKKKIFSNALSKQGFELLESQDNKAINQIKSYLVEKILYKKHHSEFNLSNELSSLMNKEYSYISKLFSKGEGMTIEQFVSHLRIARVKELISYDELSLTEIAYEVGFTSVSHLSNQFKKLTGMSPSAFKKLSDPPRKPMDEIRP